MSYVEDVKKRRVVDETQHRIVKQTLGFIRAYDDTNDLPVVGTTILDNDSPDEWEPRVGSFTCTKLRYDPFYDGGRNGIGIFCTWVALKAG